MLKLLAISDSQGLHGEDLVHQFPSPEPVLVDHVLPLVVTLRAVLVTHPVMSGLCSLEWIHLTFYIDSQNIPEAGPSI